MYKYCLKCRNKNRKKDFLYTTCANLYFSLNLMNNLLSYCGLTDSRMRASDNDLPVSASTCYFKVFKNQYYCVEKIPCTHCLDLNLNDQKQPTSTDFSKICFNIELLETLQCSGEWFYDLIGLQKMEI